MRTSTILTSVLLLGAASAARAQAPRPADKTRSAQVVYRWVDASGHVHYTNEPARLPEKAKVDTTSGGEISVLSPGPRVELSEEELERRREAERKEQQHEQHWRTGFRTLRNKIEVLETTLKADRARLGDPQAGLYAYDYVTGRFVESPEAANLRQRVHRMELELGLATRELEDLERDATRLAIPREWRR